MIPLEILNRKSLFSLLHKIDLDLAEQARVRRCPFAGGRCIMRTMPANLEAALLILMRHLRFVIACAAAVKGADAVFSQHRSDSGSAGYTGRLFYSSSLPFDKEAKIKSWSFFLKAPFLYQNRLFKAKISLEINPYLHNFINLLWRPQS